jgi:hypothetical protein
MNIKEKLAVIEKYIAGTSDDIAMMIPCHVNTYRKMKSGDENIRFQTSKNLDALYQKALEVKAVMES